jgi:broad specificity phosphatase PhoE
MTKKKKEATVIYVVRHGESESNVYAHENPDLPASQYGELGSSLTQKGRDQAKKLAKNLDGVSFAAIFSSDLNRAKETAEILAQGRNVNVEVNETIRERFFGEHMSKIQKQEIEKKLDKLREEEKFYFNYFPNGESGYDVINRFKKFLLETIPAYRNKVILIVSHSYVMRSFLVYTGYAKHDEIPSGSIKNAGYFVIETDGKSYNVVKKYGIKRNGVYDDDEE